jgi:hypothetical protein
VDPHWYHGFIADPDPHPGSQTNADPPHPDPGKAFKTHVRHVTGTGSGLFGGIPRVVVQISALT